jgi:uncharacterized membrane protein
MIRLLIIAVPLLTFLVPRRWFRHYVIALAIVSVFFGTLFAVERIEAAEPGESMGLIAIIAYFIANAVLIALRAMWMQKPPRAKQLALPPTTPPPEADTGDTTPPRD